MIGTLPQSMEYIRTGKVRGLLNTRAAIADKKAGFQSLGCTWSLGASSRLRVKSQLVFAQYLS
jgi:hypothetical protein